jgi:two-component system, response regulator
MDKRSILLVEDNPDDEKLTLRAFKKSNVANPIVVVRDGQEALDYLLDHSKPAPAVIMLDLKLPKVDGIEVLGRLRKEARTSLIPIIVLTSSTLPADIAACYKLGCNSYIRKPVDFAKFAEAIGALNMYWLVLNEPPPGAH